MQNLDGSLGVLGGPHHNEAISLGFVGIAVVNDLDALHGTNALEEIFEFILGGLVGEIAEVEASGVDRAFFAPRRLAASLFPFAFFGAFAATFLLTTGPALLGRIGWFGNAARARMFLGLVESEGLQDLLPEGQWDGSWLRPALGTLRVPLATSFAAAVSVAVSIPVSVAIVTTTATVSATAVAVAVLVIAGATTTSRLSSLVRFV